MEDADDFRMPQRACNACEEKLAPLQPQLKAEVSRCNQETVVDSDSQSILLPQMNFFLENEIRNAALMVNRMANSSTEENIPKDMLDMCRGVAFLTVLKVGFGFSGRYGTGLVISRLPDDTWSAPSAITLSRQKVPYINPKNSKENKCEKGAYIVKVTSHESNVTIIASGTEVELALKTQEKLIENNIHSKVVSMPCMELFDKQPEEFRNDIIEPESLVIALEAGSIMSWQKYVKNKGMNIGIDQFGESAPYKEVYSHFGLSEEKIVGFIQKKLRE